MNGCFFARGDSSKAMRPCFASGTQGAPPPLRPAVVRRSAWVRMAGNRKMPLFCRGSGNAIRISANVFHRPAAVGAGRVRSGRTGAIPQLHAPRGVMTLGQATFGAFLVDTPGLGITLSARGFEDRGDNAILNR
jgi:hypothetical protein